MSANSKLAALPPSGIRIVQNKMRTTSIDLGIGQPSLMPDAGPFAIAAERVRRDGCPYPPYNGLPELRAAVAKVYGGRYHDKPDNVCVTNGSQEAIYLAIKALLEPGRDEVLIVDPGYPSYGRCCALEGVAKRTVPTEGDNGFRVRAGALLDAVGPATRMIIIGSPSNPSGSLFSAADVNELARGLSARSGEPVIVVVDEVYRELTFADEGFASMADAYPHTVVVQSLSKSCALTGLRIGFFVGPEPMVQLATRAHMLMMMSVSLPAQYVALEIFKRPDKLRAHHSWYAAQRTMMLETARAARLPIVKPDGAFYAMVRLPDRWRSDSIGAAYALLDEYDVVTVPGSVFGRQGEGYLRATWAADEVSVREGFTRLGEFVRK